MENVVGKRLLLSKEFHLNGVELAKRTDPLSKMMAVHNFHIAVEIAVKCILLKFEIRNEKTLNIDFESMLNDIDRHKEFQERGLKLSYRQEIRNLNQMRNFVQHHAMEPDQSSMDDWRLFSSKFLTRLFKDYFDVNFEKVNRLSFVNDSCLTKFLSKALDLSLGGDFISASCLATAAFKYASSSLYSLIPSSSASFFIGSSLRSSGLDSGGIQRAFDQTHERINQSEHFAALLASGLNLSDYRKYIDNSPVVLILYGGKPVFQDFGNKTYDCESTSWLINFVITTIIKWQQLGLEPRVSDLCLTGATEFIDNPETSSRPGLMDAT